jgi:hypothetical protein
MAHFFTSSEIWNVDGDYLSADAGMYDKAQDLYMVTRNGYILTKDQELWGDTLSYYRTSGYVEGRGNIQMDDFKEKMMAFGDYAEYWQDPGNMLLTRRPSVISYDLSQSDSVFMRADTISVRTISVLEERAAAEKAAAEKAAAEAQQTAPRQNTPSSQPAQSSATQQAVTAEDADVDYEDDQMLSEEQPADSVQKDSVVLSDKELRAQIKAQAKAEARKAKEEAQKVKAAARKLKLDSIARIRQAKVTAMLDRQKAKELARYQKDSVRRAERRAKQRPP